MLLSLKLNKHKGNTVICRNAPVFSDISRFSMTVGTLVAIINFAISAKKIRESNFNHRSSKESVFIFHTSAWVSLKCQFEFVSGQCVSDLFGWSHSLLSGVCQSQQLLSKYLQCLSTDEVIRTLMTQPQAGQCYKHAYSQYAEDTYIFAHSTKSTSFRTTYFPTNMFIQRPCHNKKE